MDEIQDAIQNQKASSIEDKSPDYDQWKDQKIRVALEHADTHPKDRIPQDEIWKRFDLEY